MYPCLPLIFGNVGTLVHPQYFFFPHSDAGTQHSVGMIKEHYNVWSYVVNYSGGLRGIEQQLVP
jgi:hypothetical protein